MDGILAIPSAKGFVSHNGCIGERFATRLI
jgi:hypothetical protein